MLAESGNLFSFTALPMHELAASARPVAARVTRRGSVTTSDIDEPSPKYFTA
jgi:hypothetical protein